jgi:hypothetical protein
MIVNVSGRGTTIRYPLLSQETHGILSKLLYPLKSGLLRSKGRLS